MVQSEMAMRLKFPATLNSSVKSKIAISTWQEDGIEENKLAVVTSPYLSQFFVGMHTLCIWPVLKYQIRKSTVNDKVLGN